MPSETLRSFSGRVVLREDYDDKLLMKELASLGYEGLPFHVSNPRCYRKKNSETWIKIGESSDREKHFSVSWDTKTLENGDYEVMGFMHVVITRDEQEFSITRQNIMEVRIEN